MTCFSVGVLILVVIMLVIHQKRKAQYDVTGKSPSDTLRPLAVKSFDDKNGSEFVFPNPTDMDCETHNNEFDQKADWLYNMQQTCTHPVAMQTHIMTISIVLVSPNLVFSFFAIAL